MRGARVCRSVALGFCLAFGLGCSPVHQAYLDWRPGLSPTEFDGTFELSLDEYQRFDDEGQVYLRFDRMRGVSKADASERMGGIGQSLASAPALDPRGMALLSLGSDGRVVLRDGQGSYEGQVDWFASDEGTRHAALFSGTKLSVFIEGASAGLDAAALLGTDLAAHHLMMSVSEEELTVFALPQLGGAIAANEPGFLFSFRHQPGAREAWDITVARVSVSM